MTKWHPQTLICWAFAKTCAGSFAERRQAFLRGQARRGKKYGPLTRSPTFPAVRLPTAASAWLALALTACSPGRQAIDAVSAIVRSPPGTTRLPSGLHVDIDEVNNIGYKEYLYWTQRIFGRDSEAFAAALPDTTVWSILGLDEVYGGVYFRDISYNDYPMVGISHQQAVDYCIWRTHRVAELQLITLGLLEFLPRTDSTYFTVEAYAAGTYPLLGPALPLTVAYYRLPTHEEWSYLSAVSEVLPYGVDLGSRPNRQLAKPSGLPFNTEERLAWRAGKQKVLDAATLPSAQTCANRFGLRATVGNVREMTSVLGEVRGGSYLDALALEVMTRTEIVEGPNAFTGFRCVAEARRVTYGR